MVSARAYTPIPSTVCRCRDGLIVNEHCTKACGTCGWNPEVEERRKQQIRQYAAAGRLKEWGKDNG